jgi:hypothetical protein
MHAFSLGHASILEWSAITVYARKRTAHGLGTNKVGDVTGRREFTQCGADAAVAVHRERDVQERVARLDFVAARTLDVYTLASGKNISETGSAAY